MRSASPPNTLSAAHRGIRKRRRGLDTTRGECESSRQAQARLCPLWTLAARNLRNTNLQLTVRSRRAARLATRALFLFVFRYVEF